MNAERWQQIKSLLQSALEREPAARPAFLDEACQGDELLRQQVNSLIISHEQAGGFIEEPAFELMAESLTNKQAELVGQTLGHYRVLEQLGAGGMGEVYLAEDARLGRKVALKMLPADLTAEDERVRRFQQEARAASALNHPNIITIYEIVEMDSRRFMATEFIDGETLFERLKAGLMKLHDALDVAVQVTSALCAAHQAGIVHRDIKPGNIMLRTDGIVKVLDFGLAMLTEQKDEGLEAATLVKTRQGTVMGTPHYMSPEQARGQKMDARTDIFSLGVVLYEMLTGRVPFGGQTMTDVLASILMLEPPSISQYTPAAPEELQRIVHQALRKDKAARYQTAGELLTDLKALKQELEFETRSRDFISSGSRRGAAASANARPETRYAKSGDVSIAYQVVGSGPVDLVYVMGWVTNLDYFWEEPSYARFLNRLASFSRLILFDKRGTGLSDRVHESELPTLEQRMDDVRAVMDAVGSERASLLGVSEGGPMAALFAATYPERTSALVMYGSYAKRIWDPAYPWAPTSDERQKFFDLIQQGWGGVVDAAIMAPTRAQDERFKDWWATYLRRSASPGAALAFAKMNTQIDITNILPTIRVPTLIVHRTGDLDANVGGARYMARQIPGAKYVELPGDDHLPFVGNQEAVLDEIENFLDGIRNVPVSDRVLATVLCLNVTGSIGASKLREHELRDSFLSLTTRELERFRGVEIETSEQTVLAGFDGPARAIRAACAVRDSARRLGIEIKAGLHTGECDTINEKLAGIAVEMSAQIAARAPAGEVLVSSTVTDLVAGSGIQFEDRGAHPLKGFEGKWRLFAVMQDSESGAIKQAHKPPPTSSRRTKAIDSLAILPLENASADPDMEYFSDGVTESIINALSQLPKLRVVARSTVFRYKGREVDPQEVGHELGVRAVLTGRVRQLGDELMIAAELIDVTNDEHLWGEHYNRKLSGIFDLQEEIAKEISERLRLQLTGEEKKRLAKRYTANAEAYQLYLRGRYFWYKRTEEALRKSIEYFNQAIAEDPAYAAAYAGLSDSYALLALRGIIAPREGLLKAKAAARKALEIDDTLGEAYASLAHVRLHEWDWPGLDEEFKRALELNPGHAIAYHWYSEYLMTVGRADESIAIIKQGQETDPLSPVILGTLGFAFFFARRYDQGIEQFRRALELDPNHFLSHYRLGHIYSLKGLHREAIEAAQTSAALSGRSTETLAGLGRAYAAAGMREETQKVLDELDERSKERYVSPYYVAKIYAALGDKEQALHWLEKGYEERNPDFIELKVEPALDVLRTDARFRDLLRRVGLAPAETFPAAHSTGTVPKLPSRKPASRRGIKSLAILPFTNTSADPNMDYLSDGLTESIINSLSQLPKLRVLARSTVFRYKGRDVDPQQAGRELEVQAVLTGRVLQIGERLIIGTELVDVDDGSQLWGEQHQRAMADIFELQEEISGQISEALRLKVSGAQKKRFMKRHTRNTQAYELYLKGRFFWNKRTPEDANRGIECFQQALALDPNFALAYTGLADCQILLGDVRLQALLPKEAFLQGRASALRALELDPDLAEAHGTLGHVSMHLFDWSRAEKELQRALELNPNDAKACLWQAYYYAFTGHFDDSIAAIECALQLDPLALPVNASAGELLYFAGRVDDAIEQFHKTIEMDAHFRAAHMELARVYEHQAMYDAAFAEFARARELSQDGPESLASLAHCYAVSGATTEAQNLLRQLTEMSDSQYVSAYEIALIHSGLGQKEECFEWLNRAYEIHDGWMIYIMVDPRWQSLRSDARFIRVVRRVGLAPAESFPAAHSISSALKSSWTGPPRKRTASKTIASLAILPLVNTSADPNMDYLSDGITESIINSLSQLPKLRVVARSTVFHYKGLEIDPQEVGQQLGVRAVLTGRVRQLGDGLMIAAELIDVANDTQLWGEHYNRKLSDIFELQEEIAKEIFEKLRLKLAGEEKKHLAKRYTENTEAYQLYLRGLYYWNKRTVDYLKRSIGYFEQAIEIDPHYALAYAGLANSYLTLGSFEALSPKEAYPRAKAAAIKALEIDPELAEAFTPLAFARFKYDWNWPDAERDFKRAIKLNPNYPTAHHWYGYYLTAMGRFEAATAEMESALRLDPLSLVINVSAGMPFLYARQYDLAIEQYRRALDLEPNFPMAHINLGSAYEYKGEFQEAVAELQKGCALDDNSENLAALGHAYAKSGRIEEARSMIEKLRDISRERYVSAYDIALIHIGLEEKDQAFQWLERACEERSYWLVHLKVDPRLDSLRSDPRFATLLRRIGFDPNQSFKPAALFSEEQRTAQGPPTSNSVALEQEIRFCTTADGVRIAYATVGAGPPLVKAANWLNHLEFDWKSPIWRHVVEEFARDHLLVRYDERGNGLSDWQVENFSFEAFVQDLATVVDSLGLGRFPILGISQGGAVAIAYAVRYPEKVSHLILYGSYARGWAKRGTPDVIERFRALKTLIKLGWGQDNPAFRQLWSTLYAPDGTPEQWQWFNDLHRISTSPDNAIRLLDELGGIDVVDLLSQVKAPTLVLHCRDEIMVPFEEGRLLAASIPGARFVALEGRNHLLLESEPAWPKFVAEVRRFLETEPSEAKRERSPSTDSFDRRRSDQQTTIETAGGQAIRTGETTLPAVTSSTDETARPTVTSSAEYVAGEIKRHKTVVSAIATIAVLVIAALIYSYVTAKRATIDSLAVLPFLNVSGDPNTEYLSDGIAESIIYSTSQLSDLKVIPRSSVFRYKGREIDPQTAGRELGVNAIMTGRVIQRGDDLSISAELVDLRDNRVLWGRQYNRKMGDVLAVQEEIAREVSEKLRRQLTTEEKQHLTRRYPENAEAYQLYLKGRYYWYKRTRDGYKKAIEEFDKAIEKDRSYALAYAGLADCYNVLSSYGIASPNESFPKGKAAALRAQEIDGSLAEARTSLAYIRYQYEWDFSGAESEYRKSIELDPNYATAHQWYAIELAGLDRMDEAIREITRAQEIDPTSLIANVNAGWIFYHARQYDRAIEQMRKSLEMDPNFARGHWAISEPLEQEHRYDEAIAELQKARQLDETPIMLALLGHVYAVSGKRDEARKILQKLMELSKDTYVDPYFMAEIHTALGERDQAFAELENAYSERSSWMVWLKVEPKFDALRSDPRYGELLKRVGLQQ